MNKLDKRRVYRDGYLIRGMAMTGGIEGLGLYEIMCARLAVALYGPLIGAASSRKLPTISNK